MDFRRRRPPTPPLWRNLLLALLLTFFGTVNAYAVVDGAVCSAADIPGGTSCNISQLKGYINEEDQALDDRAPMALNSVTGTNTIAASVTPTLTDYADRQLFNLKPVNDTTSTVTLNINTIAAKAVVDRTGTALSAANKLLASTSYLVMYLAASDHFRILDNLANGNTVGAVSSTDNAIARFDGTTGLTLQNSGVTISDNGEILAAAGGVADAPLKFQVGTNLTTAEVGAIELDANSLYATTDAGNRGVVLAEHFMMLNANYTLTSTVAEQKLFDSTTNGRLTLESGTYEFEAMLSLTTMSATSGNGAFDILGAGGATLGTVLYEVSGVDGAVSTAAAGSTTTVIAGQTPASMVTAATGTELQAQLRGVFRVSSGGTIVPSVTLVTAAAAVVRNGSYFKCKRIGAAAVTNVGQWD